MKWMHIVAIAAVGGAVGLSAMAQDRSGTSVVAPTRDVGEYAGVRPGSSNNPPRLSRVQSRRGRSRLLTWPGFEMRSSGSRFFLQVSSLVPTETASSDGRFEVILRGVGTHVRNTRRPLITRFFNTPVTSAKVQRRGRNDLAVVFQMRANVTPRVSNAPGSSGFYFIYIDFPAGQYTEQAPTLPLPTEDDRPILTNRPDDSMDNERPPSY